MLGGVDSELRKILIIDDDDRLVSGIQDFLGSNGYDCRSLASGKAAVEAIEMQQPDIVLLDVMMPGEDGFSVLARIRATCPVPVIMLTARGEDTDRIVGLELGADDYLPKPFNPRELLARIKAVLRRSDAVLGVSTQQSALSAGPSAQNHGAGAYDSDPIRLGSYELDIRQQRITLGKKSVALSTAELCILHAFMTHPGKTLGRDELQLLSFGRGSVSNSRSIDVHISRLRALLKRLGEKSTRIRTVWGSGYRWVEDQ